MQSRTNFHGQLMNIDYTICLVYKVSDISLISYTYSTLNLYLLSWNAHVFTSNHRRALHHLSETSNRTVIISFLGKIFITCDSEVILMFQPCVSVGVYVYHDVYML